MGKVELAIEYLLATQSEDTAAAFEAEQHLSILVETMTRDEENEFIELARSYNEFFGRNFSSEN